MNKIYLTPSRKFYQNFRLYTPNRRCEKCHQIIKSKRPDTKFIFLGFQRNNPDMIRVEVTGRKHPWRLHKDFFEPFER